MRPQRYRNPCAYMYIHYIHLPPPPPPESSTSNPHRHLSVSDPRPLLSAPQNTKILVLTRSFSLYFSSPNSLSFGYFSPCGCGADPSGPPKTNLSHKNRTRFSYPCFGYGRDDKGARLFVGSWEIWGCCRARVASFRVHCQHQYHSQSTHICTILQLMRMEYINSRKLGF